eukprot:747534-Hanusia_phi.AAC.4
MLRQGTAARRGKTFKGVKGSRCENAREVGADEERKEKRVEELLFAAPPHLLHACRNIPDSIAAAPPSVRL